MGLQFYLPAGGDKAGLDLAGRSVSERGVTKGPGGSGPGTVFAVGANSMIGFYEDEQSWHKSSDGSHWFGWCNDSRPTPDDLARARQIEGHQVTLADGNDWLIPCVRQFMIGEDATTYHTTLPRTLELDDQGEWIYGDVSGEHRRLYDFGVTWWDFYFANAVDGDDTEPRKPLTVAWTGESCYEALRTNYHITREQMAMLALVQSTHESEILGALIDEPTLLAMLQKKSGAQRDDK